MSSLSPASPPSHKDSTKPLPPGWKWVKLGDISFLISKGTTPTSLGQKYTDYGIPFLRAEDVNGWEIEVNKIPLHISQETDEILSRSQLQPGDFVITIAGTLGRVGYIPHNASYVNCNQAVAFARIDKSKVDVQFLCLVCRDEFVIARLLELKMGGALQNLNLQQIRQFELPLPPLPEQKRIAAILKEQLTAIDKARKAAEERLAAVKALPAAFLRRVFPHPGQPLPEGWKWVKLGEVIRLRSGEFLPSSKMGSMGMFPVYGGNGITGYHDSYMLEEEKVIIGRVGALCGCVHIAKPKSWITDNALYIDIKKIPLNNEYLLFLLTNMNLHRKANQMGVPVISSSSIYELIAPFPPLNEQQHIAAILMEQIAGAERARIAAEEELKTINALAAAILRKAFNGEI